MPKVLLIPMVFDPHRSPHRSLLFHAELDSPILQVTLAGSHPGENPEKSGKIQIEKPT